MGITGSGRRTVALWVSLVSLLRHSMVSIDVPNIVNEMHIN